MSARVSAGRRMRPFRREQAGYIGIGNRRGIGGGQTWAQRIAALRGGSEFYAPLSKSLVLERGTGSPTFTRATSASFTDWEGVMRYVPAGCARFQNGRMVRNLVVGSSENLTNANWSKSNVTAPSAGVLQDTDTAAGSYHYVTQAAVTVGNTIIQRYWLKAGTRSIAWILSQSTNAFTYFDLATGTVGNVAAGHTAAISGPDASGYYECQVKYVATGTVSGFGMSLANGTPNYDGTGTGTILFLKSQIEDVTGQSVQTAAEYVSVGVLSAPYHGAGVDGVEFFDTDRDGNPLSPAPTYLSEGARTNLCTKSQEFDAWNTTTAGAGSLPVVTTEQAVAPDGTTTAEKVVFSAPGAGDISQVQSVAFTTVTSSIYTSSVYVKAFAAGDVGKVLLTRHAGAAGYGTITLTASWQRVGTTETAAGVATTFDILLRPSSGGSSGTVSCYLWGAQVELGSFASSYIATAAISVQRNADVLTYPSAGNVDGTKGWCSATCASEFSTTSAVATVLGFGNSGGVGNAGLAVWATAATTMSVSDVTNRAEKTGLISTLNTLRKRASSWGGSTLQVTGDGVAPASGTFDGNTSPTVVEVGALGGSNFWFGTIGNVRIGQRALSASELQAVTS